MILNDELLKSLVLTFLTAGLAAIANKFLPIRRAFPDKLEPEKIEHVNLPVKEEISFADREKLQFELTQVALAQIDDLNKHLESYKKIVKGLENSLSIALEKNTELDESAKRHRTRAEKAEADLKDCYKKQQGSQ